MNIKSYLRISIGTLSPAALSLEITESCKSFKIKLSSVFLHCPRDETLNGVLVQNIKKFCGRLLQKTHK